MHSMLRNAPALLRTPLGRLQLLDETLDWAWPAFRGIARLYRRTLVRTTCLVTVVGSFGKSSTARAVVAALGGTPHRHIVFNTRSYVALAVFRIRPGQRHAVLEVGISGPGQMASYARTVQPDITVVTSVGSEHNRTLKTLEVTRAEKAKMVRVLPASGWAVLNGDDPNVRWMAGETAARVITFGFDNTNAVRASTPLLDWPRGTCFTLQTPVGTRPVRLRLIGRRMIYPALAAVAVGLSRGLALDQILPGLESLGPTPGRLEPILLPCGATLLRDERKTHVETIEAALEVLREVPAKRRIVVFGDVCEPPGGIHATYRSVGECVGRVATRAIFITGRNEFRAYATGATRAGLPRGEVIHARGGVREAVEVLRADLGPGDVVLVKGRPGQRLDRIGLALTGRSVRCELAQCSVGLMACYKCPMLEHGWEGEPVRAESE